MSKIQKDGIERPVYIIMDNKRRCVRHDGNGNAYITEDECNAYYGKKSDMDILLTESEYEFDRFLRGMDF